MRKAYTRSVRSTMLVAARPRPERGLTPIKAVVELPWRHETLYTHVFGDLVKAFVHAEKWEAHLRDISLLRGNAREETQQVTVWGWQRSADAEKS